MGGKAIPEGVKTRIRKLLALAQDARGNENEAASAAAKVQNLLGQYNLELSAIVDSGARAAPSIDAERERINGLDGITEAWQVGLLSTVAECNFCLYWTDEERVGTRRKILSRLVGRKINVGATLDVYDYLALTMGRLNPYPQRGKSRRSWNEGCADRLGARLYRQRVESERASRTAAGDAPQGSGFDLVLTDVYSSEADLNLDMRNGLPAGTTARERADYEARRAVWAAEAKARGPVTHAAPEPVKETAAQLRKRLEREARADRQWQERCYREQAKRDARIDPAAFSAGRDAGLRIGLDKQITAQG